MEIAHVFAGIPVSDFERALAWHERLLGRPPDLFPKDDEAVWQLAGNGWIYVVVCRARAGGGLLTLLVDDLDARLAEIAERGIQVGAIDTLPGVGRKAAVADPDGNTITFAEPVEAA